MFTHRNQFEPNQIVELNSPYSAKYAFEATIHGYHPYHVNQVLIRVENSKTGKFGKPFTIPVSAIKRIISQSLPLEIGDRVIDDDGIEGEVIACDKSLTIKKADFTTSHNLEYGMPKIKKIERSPKQNKRGGKREGAGRPSSGNPPQKRKAIQLPESIAAKLPDLKLLTELLEEFRPLAESGTLRSQKLADFYKKLDSLPKIVNYEN